MRRELITSGVHWVGDIPSTWCLRRLKDDYRVVGGGTPSAEDIDAEFAMPWATPADFSDAERVLSATARNISAKGYREIGRNMVTTAGILLSCRAPAGKVALPSLSVSFNQGCKGLSPRHRGNCRDWHFYALVDQRSQIEESAKGATFLEISGEAVKRVILPFPPIDEQSRIAAWLDLQIQRIDKRRELLGKKRELLRDLRQTLLDEVISTGLAECQFVKTGHPALRNLPAHWSLSKFKSKVFFREGPGIMAADFTDTGVPLIRIGNITPGLITMAGCNYVSPEKAERRWRQFKLRLGDLVISASASTGIVTEAGCDAVGAIPYTGLIILRPKAGLHKNFLRLFVISKSFLAQVEDYLKGSTIHHFGPTHLRQMLIPVPPLEEQEEIAAYLDRKLSQIDRQIALIDQLDDLLQQQRKAIIYEAVTGKIDLSNYEPPAPAMAA